MTTFGESFTDSELQALKESPCLLDIVRATFFFHCTDAFLALCSLIAHGKNCASPNKKIRRAARQELFSKIAYETFPIKNHANIKLSYFEVIAGLQALSERWAKYSYDELLSLVFVLDTKNKGSLSSDEFEDFTDLVEAAIYKDPSKHVEAFTALYESLRGDVIACAQDANIHLSLRDKLTALANRARYLQQTPLTMMYSLSEEYNHNCPNEVFVDLLVEMVVFVKKHHLKVEKTVVVDVSTGPVQQHTSPPSSTPSRRSSIASSNSPGRTSNLETISRLGSGDSAFEQVSVNSFTTPVKEVPTRRASIQGTTPGKEPTSASRNGSSSMKSSSTFSGGGMTPASSSKGRRHSIATSGGSFKTESLSPKIEEPAAPRITSVVTSVEQSIPEATSETASDKLVKASEALSVTRSVGESEIVPSQGKSGTDVGVSADLDEVKKVLVAEKLKEFKSKEDEIKDNLDALDKQLVESQNAWNSIQQAKQDKHVISPALPKDVETVLNRSPSKKEKPINPFSTPVKETKVVPAAAAVGAVTTGVSDAKNPEKGAEEESVVIVTPSNIDGVLQTINRSSGPPDKPQDVSVDDASVSVISSIAPPSVASTGGSSAVVTQKALQRIHKATSAASLVRTGSGRNLHNTSSSTISVNGSIRSFSTVGRRVAATATPGDNDDTRDHSRYQEPPKAVNMNIFRTPLHRQRHPNRNQFDPKNTCWMPTKVSNRYNERFQYPSDLRIADKINSVFYNNINPR